MGHQKQNQTAPLNEGDIPELQAAFYQSLMHHSALGFWVLDDNGRFLQVNDAYLQRSGYTRQELLSRHLNDLTVSKANDGMAVHQRIIQERGHHQFESQHRTKSGDVWAVEITATYADGRFFAIIRDITYRKKIESELHQKSRALEHSLNGFDIVSAAGTFLYANRAYLAMWGYASLDEIIGTSPAAHCADPNIPAQIIQNLEAHGSYTLVFTAKRKDGSTFEVMMASQKMVDDEGTVTYSGTSIDITALLQARQSLHTERTRLRSVLDAIPDLVWLKDPNGVYLACNPAFERMLGVPEAELLGKTDNAFFEPGVANFFREHDHQAMLAGKSQINEESVTHVTDGRIIHTETIKTPIRDKEGQILGILGIARDITDRKKMEEALRKSEAQLAGIFDSAMDAIVSIDEQQNIIFFNAAAEHMFGYSADEIVGKNHNSLLPSRYHEIHFQHVNQFGQSGVGQRNMGNVETLLGKRANGEEFPVEVSLSRVEVDDNTFYTAIMRDITQRKAAEQALRDSEERLELALQGADLGLWDWHLATGHVTFNERWAEMLGYSLAELDTHVSVWENLIDPDDWLQVMESLQAHLNGRTHSYQTIHRLRCKNGSWKWILDRGRVLERDEAGQALRMVGTHLDITDRKLAEEALLASEERLHLFIDHAPAALAMFDQEMRYLAHSHRWLADYGLIGQDILGQSHYDIFPEITDRWKAIHQRCLAGEVIRAEEDPFVRLDGYTQWLRWEVRPWYTPSTEVGGIVIFSEDITVRKEAETAVKEMQTVLAEAETVAKSGSWKWDILTQKATWSSGVFEIFGIDRQNITGNVYELIQARIHPNDLEKANQVAINTFVNYQPGGVEFRLLLPDGTERVIWEEGRVNKDENGRPVAMVGYIQDITERKRAEEKIEELQQILAEAETIAKIGSWKWEFTRQNLTWSAEMYNLFGVDPANNKLDLGQVIQERIHPDDIAAVERSNISVMEAHKPIPLEYRVVLPDGTQRVVWAEGRLIHDETGQPTALVGYAQDITERKQAEEALRQSEERFSTAFKLSPGALSLTREDGTFLDVNESYEKLSGYSRDELLNQDATQLNIFTAEQRADLRQRMVAADNQLREAEITIRRKSGELRHVLYSVEAVNIKSEPCALTLAFDITERKQAEEIIAQLNQRLELILNSAGEGIYGTDADGRITFINPVMAHMLGREPEELQGQDAHATFHYAYLDGTPYPAEKCAIRTAVQNGKAHYNNSDIFWHKDGAPIFVEYTTTPIFHTSQVVGSVTMVRDITQRKKAAEDQAILEEQLRQAQKMESIGRLAGGVAHDFNNQLAVIKLYGDLMRHGMSNHDPLLPKLEQIRQAVDRATDLTRQLLAFSRKQVLQPVSLNINNLVTNLEKMLGRLIGEDIALSTNLFPGLWPIMADPGQLEQVIMNLVINARDAMPTGGLLTVETRNVHANEQSIHVHQDMPTGLCVLLAITDTGYGMNEATSKQIFEPFFTTKQPGQGTGLGLATVHGIVKQSGGTIYVYSEPNQGTTFKIYLPANLEAGSLPMAAAGPGAAQTGIETILLVEDEPALCELIKETLAEIGYTVLAAQNGEEALAIAHTYPSPIDLLLTDVVLPQMSGREIAEEVTAVHPQTKVLFISGYMDDAVMRHGILMADVNFLSKPFSRSDLASKVREALEHSS